MCIKNDVLYLGQFLIKVIKYNNKILFLFNYYTTLWVIEIRRMIKKTFLTLIK